MHQISLQKRTILHALILKITPLSRFDFLTFFLFLANILNILFAISAQNDYVITIIKALDFKHCGTKMNEKMYTQYSFNLTKFSIIRAGFCLTTCKYRNISHFLEQNICFLVSAGRYLLKQCHTVFLLCSLAQTLHVCH